MQKRPCGRTGLDFTAISFGCMRMHSQTPEQAQEWGRFVGHVAKAGFNYFETSCGYCSGTSEIKIGQGLKGLPREKLYVSTKSFPDKTLTAEGTRQSIDESMAKLQVEYLDFYQMWCLGWKSFNDIAAKPGGPMEGVRKAMKEGLIRHLGFTCHDTPENMIKLLRTGEFESITLQYNLLDRANEPVIAEAGRLGIGVVVMGPLHGGILGYESPALNRLLGVSSTAEAAFRFVLSNPNVTTAVSGMMTDAEIQDNVRICRDLRPLTAAELSAVDQTLAKFESASNAMCTGCRYCMPCPKNVGISEVFRLANSARIYGLLDGSRRDYAMFGKEWPYDQYADASQCAHCDACAIKCPQKIAIPDELAKAHELLK